MNDAEQAKREQEWAEFFAGTGAPWTEAEKLRLRLCTAAQWCEIAGERTDGAEEAIANIMAVVDALTEQDAQPDAPLPDWTTAPEWAQWWAVDADGMACWYTSEPKIYESVWGPEDDRWHVTHGLVDLPLGVDWRTTLRRRPEVTAK